jgi:hypothetical protein
MKLFDNCIANNNNDDNDMPALEEDGERRW